MTQIFIIWLLFANYAIFIFPNYLHPFSVASVVKILISVLISLLIVVLIFCPSILIVNEEGTISQYEKKVKWNNRIIIWILCVYRLAYILSVTVFARERDESILLQLLAVIILTTIDVTPDAIILILSKKLAFKLWVNKDVIENACN